MRTMGQLSHICWKGGPAARSKLINVGDILIEVDGKSVVDHPFEKTMEMLHGDKNTKVKLTFKRPGDKGEAAKIYTVELTSGTHYFQ